MYDVIVVGAGPGGSAAAKKCADLGLKTLLIERRKLPRNKVCSGMVMSNLAQGLVKREFGSIPEEVLSNPGHLEGLDLHVVGVGKTRVEHKIPISWRRDLDYWMNLMAKESGTEILDGVQVTGVTENQDCCMVKLVTGGKIDEVRSKFVVGADGAVSVIRKSILPTLDVHYVQVLQECFEGKLALDADYYHFFYYPETAISPSFEAHHKQGYFIIDTMSLIGDMKRSGSVQRAKRFLADYHDFELESKPLWTAGCLMPIMYRELESGAFRPCKGNVLLVGEAAQLMPVMAGDGIREAIWSGLLAASSIYSAIENQDRAEIHYMSEMSSLIKMRNTLYPWARKIREEAQRGGEHLLSALGELWRESMDMGLEYLDR